MRGNRIIALLALSVLIAGYKPLFSAADPSLENNTEKFAAWLSDEIIKNPSAEITRSCIDKLIQLAPALGNKRFSTIFSNVIKKLEIEGEKGKLAMQILRLSADNPDAADPDSVNSFSVIRKWYVSGPWKRYGKPDRDYRFPPEKGIRVEDFEIVKSLSTENDGKLYPYKFNHEADQTYYAVSSFSSSSGIILWVITDAQYKLIVNGREISQNNKTGKRIIKAFALSGARGYTVELKIQCENRWDNPYVKCLVTDEKHLPVQLNPVSSIFNYTFTSEDLFIPNNIPDINPCEAAILTAEMNRYLLSGHYIEGYNTGKEVTEKFPFYYPAYEGFIRLLDITNRDAEFHGALNKFREKFPESEIHDKWIADFYLTRNTEKFSEIMKRSAVSHMSIQSIEAYIFLLCGEKNYTEALKLCNSMKSDPRIRHIIPDILKASGDYELWRKSLIEETTIRSESYFYYALGLAEMQMGIDPVMYWHKGYYLDTNSGMLRDLSDIYENSIIGPNDFYTGAYTDFHPEFRWAGKKRNITVNISNSGKVILEGEDIIPPVKNARSKFYFKTNQNLASGEIETDIPYIEGLKILYVLTVKDGLPAVVDFKSGLDNKKRFYVKYNSSGEEEFSVIKYSIELSKNQNDAFFLLRNLVLKAPDEKMSELRYEVNCDKIFSPSVSYKGQFLPAGHTSDDDTRFEIADKFSEEDSGTAVSGIFRFSSDKEFAEWYSKIISYTDKSLEENLKELELTGDTESIIKKIYFYIMFSVSRNGEVNFNPGRLDSVLMNGKGSVEERTLLARAILAGKGIKSLVSFKKNAEGVNDRILLYVPESRTKGYWLDFYGDFNSEKIQSGSNAIIITGEGYETYPVNPDTYIR